MGSILRSIEDSHRRSVAALAGWLEADGVVDFLARGAVQIQDFKAKAGGLDNDLGQGIQAHIVKLAVGRDNILIAVRLDVRVARHERDVVVGMRLDPRVGQELEVEYDAHAHAVVVECLEQNVVGLAVHLAQRSVELGNQIKGRFRELAHDVWRVSGIVEQVRHRHEPHLLVLNAVHVALPEQGLVVREGDSCGQVSRQRRGTLE